MRERPRATRVCDITPTGQQRMCQKPGWRAPATAVAPYRATRQGRSVCLQLSQHSESPTGGIPFDGPKEPATAWWPASRRSEGWWLRGRI